MKRRHLTPVLVWLVHAAAAAQVLTLHYQERPPYSSVQRDGRVAGLVATPAAAALERAGIAFRWERTPSQRQLALIQSAAGAHCGIGWFRNEERAALGRFSAALYQDQPLAALVRDGAAVAARTTAAELFAEQRFRLLVKDGYSYGADFDRRIAAMPRPPLRTSTDPPQMSEMLRSGRADWMIVAPEEASVLGGSGLRLVLLSDVPLGPSRHLYCSRAVPPEWLERIDRALAAR